MPVLTSIVASVSLLSPSFQAPPAPATTAAIHARVESSLPTDGDKIRQYAFDGDPARFFASKGEATKADHLTLTFEKPVTIKTVKVLTGRPDGTDAITTGVLETSADGTAFETLAPLAGGKVDAPGKGRKVLAVRVRPTEDGKTPLVVREITVDSDPAVVTFKNPVEFALDVTDAPDMKAWGDKAVRVCERQYDMICEELASEGYKPPTQIRMILKTDYDGVAAAGGGRITGSVKYFKSHPDDIGAMVHETAHCVQQYRARRLPGWLVEGIADYVRFWKYEPGKAGKLSPERAKYDASYRTSAAFLAYVSDTYDKKLVNKLNAQLRENKYSVESWKTITGKTVEELNQEWKKSLAK